MRVYEDFMRIPHRSIGGVGTESTKPRQESRPNSIPPEIDAAESPMIPLVQVVEKAQTLVTDLNRLLIEHSNVSLQSLNAQHPVKIAVQQLFWLISQSGNPDESCLIFSEKIVNYLFLTESSLAREVYVLVLRRLADFSKPLANELTEWFMYNTDSQKYNVDVIVLLLRADIITCLELDIHISRQAETAKDSFIGFILDLLYNCCLAEDESYSYVDFLYTYESLRRGTWLTQKERYFN